MKKKYYQLLVLFLITLLSSCHQKGANNKEVNTSSKKVTHIQLYQNIDNESNEFLLSDVATNITIVPLETNSKSIFKNADNICIGDNYIFINAINKILCFDKNGKFQQTISQIGNGPEDFNYCAGIGIDNVAQLIYVASGFPYQNQIKTFTFDGKWIKTIQAAEPGSWTLSNQTRGEDHTYAFWNNRHILRRMLPSQDGKPGLQQIAVRDTSGGLLFEIIDPANIGYDSIITQKAFDLTNLGIRLGAHSPVLNRYKEHMTCLFDSNDTIYKYTDNETLTPRYILDCGERPSFKEIRTQGKEMTFFSYLFVTNIMETKDYLYLVSEKDQYTYLSKVNKETGAIGSICRTGEIKHSKMLNSYIKRSNPPVFTNDLCGGTSFYPDYQNNKQWIMLYSSENLLTNIRIDSLKEAQVKCPEQRDQLVHILENMKEDDNDILMIVTLK